MYIRLLIAMSISTALLSSVDCIVYSFDRPMQLEAFLESYDYYCSNKGRVEVIYRASNKDFARGYTLLKDRYPTVIFTQQGNAPAQDFKVLTMRALAGVPNKHLLFAVDDIIITDFVDLDECISALEQSGAYAFYLRLGLNLNYCYTMNQRQPLPQYRQDGAYIIWAFQGAAYDWGYPNTLDMAIYRKDDILPIVTQLSFKSPNTFEGSWASIAPRRSNGISFLRSKMINIPVNIVQSDCNNRNMNQHHPEELLKDFLQGKKINIHAYHNYENASAHVEAPLHIIERNS